MKKHFRLTIDLDIDLDDQSGSIEKRVTELLNDIPKRAAGEGWFTGETPATVASWGSKLEVTPVDNGKPAILVKSIFTAEVLHEPEAAERVGQMDFANVVAECMDGEFSGQFSLVEQIPYTNRKDADAAIEAQSSDPSFFFGDDDDFGDDDEEK